MNAIPLRMNSNICTQ